MLAHQERKRGDRGGCLKDNLRKTPLSSTTHILTCTYMSPVPPPPPSLSLSLSQTSACINTIIKAGTYTHTYTTGKDIVTRNLFSSPDLGGRPGCPCSMTSDVSLLMCMFSTCTNHGYPPSQPNGRWVSFADGTSVQPVTPD